jgi:cytoskeletal protein CcmA (bactofilin family)
MWNRKKEDEDNAPRISQQPPTSAELSREGIPMSTLPIRPQESSASGAGIGKAVIVKGQVYSREDLYVDGEVEGSIEMPESRLTVGPNGRVEAGIKAREVVVLGTVHGNVEVGDKIDIRKDAKLVGDIRTVRITIEDGAYFKGSIDIVKPDAAKAGPKPVPAVQPAKAPTASVTGAATPVSASAPLTAESSR